MSFRRGFEGYRKWGKEQFQNFPGFGISALIDQQMIAFQIDKLKYQHSDKLQGYLADYFQLGT